jgi:hypothetical protein
MNSLINVLNLKTLSFIFSNLFLIPRTLFPDYIYKISQNMGERRMKMNNEIRRDGKIYYYRKESFI